MDYSEHIAISRGGDNVPKGSPNRQTIASEKYQKKAGYKAKTYKFKGDIADRFAAACERAGVSQSAKLTELMEKFISETT